MLEIILEIFLEIGLEIVAELLIETGFHGLRVAGRALKALNLTGAVLLYLTLGALIGLLSLLFFPRSFVRSANYHGISLILTPLFTGLAMSGVGLLRRRLGKPVVRLDTFGYAFVFAFGMALIRFLFYLLKRVRQFRTTHAKRFVTKLCKRSEFMFLLTKLCIIEVWEAVFEVNRIPAKRTEPGSGPVATGFTRGSRRQIRLEAA